MRRIVVNSKRHGKHFILIDDEDYELVSKHRWHVMKVFGFFYAYTNINSSPVAMHRFLLRVTDRKIYVDHKDKNGLNNQRNNIRTCTPAQNHYNTKGRLTLSKYKGIAVRTIEYTSKKTGEKKVYTTFEAKIQFEGKRRYLGCFKNEDEAAKVYNEAALKYFGEFAHLNQVSKQ